MTETMALTASSVTGDHRVSMSYPIIHMSDNHITRCSTQQSTDGWSWSDIPCGGFVEEVPWKLPSSSSANVSCDVDDPTCQTRIKKPSTTKSVPSLLPTRTVSHQRHVSFSPTVQIRTHELIPGDHPCCKDGLALDCGWEILVERQAETTTGAHSGRRMAKLLLTPKERWIRLHGSAPHSADSEKLGLPRTDSQRELMSR